MKKRLLIAAALTLGAVAAYAGCTSQVVNSPDGKTLTCVTCCDGQGKNCVTNCY